MRSVTHGGDVAAGGDGGRLSRSEQVSGERLGVQARARLGPEIAGAKSVRILDRIAEWRPNGIQRQVDQRHVDEAARAPGFAEGRAAVTPAVRETA